MERTYLLLLGKFDSHSYNATPSDFKLLWVGITVDYFKDRFEDMETTKYDFIAYIRKHFFSCQWYEAYNFLEFVKDTFRPDSYAYDEINKNFIDYCNRVLEEELSAFRFVGGTLTSITSKEEIEAIETAMNIVDQFSAVKTHLLKSLRHLANKLKPDYENSVKESISAVESLCRILTGNPKATLGQALKLIPDLHPALQKSYETLYGYTSDAGGIRHVRI